ncbi:MAG: hypothetical protein NTX53_18710 [candidate division WOR-3 bacterium]|nr:hypothetical protein [candidate division WOR-3 bacterium]
MKIRTSVESYLGCRIVGSDERGRQLKASDGVSDVAFSARARVRGTEKLYVVMHKGEFPDLGEGVEAELVYLIRQGTRQRPGKWPVDQYEIHFRHSEGVPAPECLKAARDIYRELAKA